MASGSLFSVGTTTTVTCTAIDNANNQAFCPTFNVVVPDTIPPMITCPNAQTAAPVIGSSTVAVSYPPPTATDNVALTTVSCSPSTGSAFPLGNNAVTCTATDTSGNTASCSFLVTILDKTPPVITCPGNYSAFTSSNAPTGVINWGKATATDTFSSATVSCPLFGTTTFAVGTTIVTCTSTDAAGNTASCSFGITVVDNQPPDITCPASFQDPLGPGQSNKTESWSIQTSDNVGVASQICNPSSGSVLQYGSHIINCMAQDVSGNVASCSFTLSIINTQPPIIVCPATYIGQTSLNANTGVVVWKAPSTLDHTANSNVGINFVSCSVPLTQNVFPLGKTPITCTAYDLSLNSASCSFDVTIQDKQPPAIVCPASQSGTLAATDPSTSLQFNFDVLQPPTDNVDSVASGTIGVKFQVNGATVSIYSNWALASIGITFFTYSAFDSSNNSVSCTFTSTVAKLGLAIDLIPPIVNCPQQLAFYFLTDPQRSTAIAAWPVITATDNVGVTSEQYITNPPGLYRGAAFPIGNSSVKFYASDAAGNYAECSFFVIVQDTEPPRVTCPNSFTQYCNPPFRKANVTWIAPTYTDNDWILSASFSRSPGEYPAGTYEVYASAVDTSGNSANCSFSFTVITFTVPPTVTCPLSQTVNTDFNRPNALVSWPQPEISSQTGIQSAIYQPSQFYPPASFPIGTTAVRYIVTDIFLNVKICSFKITVLDKEPPSITCPNSLTLQMPPGSASIVVNWQSPIKYDNVAVETITESYQPLSEFTPGTYSVEAYCNDTSGNISPPCYFNITILPAPVYTTIAQNGSKPTPNIANPAASTSASSSIATGAGGAGAGLAILIILIVVLVVLRRKRQNAVGADRIFERKMTDEEILASAQAITLGLHANLDRVIQEPNKGWLNTSPDEFKAPPATAADIAGMIANLKRELHRDTITLNAVIGRGEFGEVYSGKIRKADGTQKLVAIKTLKAGSNESSQAKFLQEACVMAQFKNPRIVALIGVVSKTEPALIVLEYMEMGSLLSYLKNPLVKDHLADTEMTRFACQICAGMHYLAEKSFIHRDLAARNVLVNKLFVCKIADFGLCQIASVESASKSDKIPVRWTAPEATARRQYTTASDVWSFGVLLQEIWTFGDIPYGSWNNERIINEVAKGYRLVKPKKCSSAVYSLMLECWEDSPLKRPSFYDIFQRLLSLHKNNIQKEADQGLYMAKTAEDPVCDEEVVEDEYLYMANPNEDYSRLVPGSDAYMVNANEDYSRLELGSDAYLDGNYLEQVKVDSARGNDVYLNEQYLEQVKSASLLNKTVSPTNYTLANDVCEPQMTRDVESSEQTSAAANNETDKNDEHGGNAQYLDMSDGAVPSLQDDHSGEFKEALRTVKRVHSDSNQEATLEPMNDRDDAYLEMTEDY